MSRPSRTVATVLLITAAAPLPLFLVGACAVLIREELAVSNATFGAGLSAFFASAGITAIFGGRLVDRLGWRRAVAWTAVGSVMTFAATAFLTRSFAMLVGFLVLGGATLSLGIPAGSRALLEEMPPERRALMFGIGQSSAAVATMLAGLSIPALALRFGWRSAFAAALVLPLAALAFRPPAGPPAAAAPAPAPTVGRRRVDPVLLGFAVVSALGAFAIGALTGFFVLSNVAAGMPAASAGRLLAVASILGIATRITAGWGVDRTGSRGFLPVSALMAVGAVGFGLLATGSLFLAALAAVLAYCAGWGWPGVLYYGVAMHRPDAPGRATGIVQVGMSVGMVSGPLVFGQVVDRLGFGPAWMVVAGVEALAAVLMMGLSRQRVPPVLDDATTLGI